MSAALPKRTPTREHNHLADFGEFFVKSSRHPEKIRAERRYYENLPPKLQRFHPRYLGPRSDGHWPEGYAIEKIPSYDVGLHHTQQVPETPDYQTLFRELTQFWQLSPKIKQRESKLAWFERDVFERDRSRVRDLQGLGAHKIVDQELEALGFGTLDQYLDRLHEAIRSQLQGEVTTYFSHGDLCFSNLLLYRGQLYLVDPRGLPTEGDGQRLPEYDLAKLSQCIHGNYDYINLAHPGWEKTPARADAALLLASLAQELEVPMSLVRLVESAHFLSMIPLHLKESGKTQKFVRQSARAFHAGTRG